MKGKLVVFDPQVFNRTKGLLSDWKNNRADWKKTFGQWRSDFDSATPEWESNINKENDYFKFLRDGGFESQLSGLRAREREADQREKANALDFAEGATERSRFAGGAGIGGSSADFARRLKAGSRIEAGFGGRDAARERSDIGWVNNMKLGTLGRINSNIDKMVNRQLTPQQLSDAELTGMIQSLAGIQGVRMGSARPVFWRDTSLWEEIAAPVDQLLSSYGIGGEPNYQDNLPKQPPPSRITGGNPYSAGIGYDAPPPSGGTNWSSPPPMDFGSGGYRDSFGSFNYSTPSWR